MSTEQLRAEFEAWATIRWLVLQRNVNGEDYQDLRTQGAWEAYQAGRAALQSQDREDALRYRWLRDSALLLSQIEQRGVSGWMVGRRDHLEARFHTYNGKELDEAIDHARRIEGGKL